MIEPRDDAIHPYKQSSRGNLDWMEEVGEREGRRERAPKTIHIEAGGRTLHVTIIADLLEWPRHPSCSLGGDGRGGRDGRERETQSQLEEEEEGELNRNTTGESCRFFWLPTFLHINCLSPSMRAEQSCGRQVA